MSENRDMDDYRCNATIDRGAIGIFFCDLPVGHSGSHRPNELLVIMATKKREAEAVGSLHSIMQDRIHRDLGVARAAYSVKAPIALVPIPVREIIRALEREAGNTDTDCRWLAATELRRMTKWEDRTLMCEIDQRPSETFALDGPMITLKAAQDLYKELEEAKTGKQVAIEWNRKACAERDAVQQEKESLLLENYSLRQELTTANATIESLRQQILDQAAM